MTRSRWWLAAGLVLLPLLGIGFLADDYAGLVYFGPQGWAGVLGQFKPKDFEFLRPLGFLLFRAELSSFGARPWLFHAAHLGLFILAAWLAGRLALRLSGPEAAPWASALALLYPGRTEVVAWIAALFDLLALVLTTVALLLAVLPDWDTKRTRAVGLAAITFVAPLAKESAYAIPVVVIVWELLGVLGRAAPITRAIRCAAALLGALLALVFRFVMLGGMGGYAGVPLTPTASKLLHVPELLARVLFAPVNPTYGLGSQILLALCISASIVVVAAFAGGNWPAGLRPVTAGLVLALVGLLPALPYLNPTTLVWTNNRFVGLAGLGAALAAAGALACAPRRWSRVAGGVLVAAWAATSLLNELPWLGAARSRDALVAAIENATRSPGAHWVWVAGPIDLYHGAQLVGGRLAEAVATAMPNRVIHVDSEFFQQLQHRPVGPPAIGSEGTLHALRFDPSPPHVTALPSGPAATPR
jgi:hypothetical protein